MTFTSHLLVPIEQTTFYFFAFQSVVRASALDVRPASINVRRRRYPPTSTSTEISNPPPARLCELRLSSDNVCSSHGTTSPVPKTKRQKVIPSSPGPVPTSGRAVRPEPRKKARIPAISVKSATHSRRFSLCRVRVGALLRRWSKDISAELVDIAEEIKTAPSSCQQHPGIATQEHAQRSSWERDQFLRLRGQQPRSPPSPQQAISGCLNGRRNAADKSETKQRPGTHRHW